MKKLLIVVDYQKDFVDGSLGFPSAVALEEKIVDKIKAYRKNNDEIVFTFDTHEKEYLDSQEGQHLPVPHCIRETNGWELYGHVADLKEESDQFFVKPTFGSGELFDYLREREEVYQSIELVGLLSNICVISNAILAKTALPEVPIIVDAACTASHDEILNDQALAVMASLQIQIINNC